MVSSLLIDALNDPIRVLKDIYDPSKEIDNFPTYVTSHFSKVFKSDDAFNEIPALDVNHPPESYASGALVHFRAMVQDTSSSPEMYLSKLKGNICGGWGMTDESASENTEYSYADLRECTVIWAVNVPGENMWSSVLSGASVLSDASDKSHKPSQPHKFPVPGAPHVGVQVKIYDNSMLDHVKSTDIVSFVGILCSEPIHSQLDRNIPLEVPTLHVLFSRFPEPAHYPYTVLESKQPDGVAEATNSSIAELREDLISWIADEGLGGDRDAAEWILLTSIARVQSRNPPILPPSLTLTCFPSPHSHTSTSPPCPTLSHVLSLILPLSLTLPLSLSLLNTSAFIPESKNEDLQAGYLQLPLGCIVLVTESGIAEGEVIEKGIMNLKALQDVINTQTLPYVFPFSQFSFPTDLGFIVLAEGRKSAFFQTSITLPLQRPTSEPTDSEGYLYKKPEQVNLPTVNKLSQFRRLVHSAKAGKVQVGEAISEHIQNDFVRERQNDKSVTADDLIMRMTIARLLALSLHEKDISVDIWERAKILDGRRKQKAT